MRNSTPTDFGIRDGIIAADRTAADQHRRRRSEFRRSVALSIRARRHDLCGRRHARAARADGIRSKIGGEFRQFLNNNFRLGTGTFNFASVPAFLADTANSFSVTLGNQSSSIAQGALGFFIQDNYKWRPKRHPRAGAALRLEYDADGALRPLHRLRSAHGIARAPGRSEGNDIYHQNNKNFQPRLGFAWDPFQDGKTSVRGAYAILVDQPITNVVVGTSGNPPLANRSPSPARSALQNAIDLAQAAGLAPTTVDHGFRQRLLAVMEFQPAARAVEQDSH